MVAITGTPSMTVTRAGVSQKLVFRASGLTAFVQLESKDLDFGDPKNSKFVDSFVLDFDDDLPFGYVLIGGRDRLNDHISWSDLVPLGDGCGQLFLASGMEFRFFRIKIVDQAPVNVWRLSSIELYGSAPEGGREGRNV